MRKIITSAILIMLFSMFSGSVFAGKDKAEDPCKEFKGQGLYGLCTAFQNALANEDQEAMDDIFDAWSKKVGDDGEPELPGYPYGDDDIELACPCWSNYTVEDLCSLGAPSKLLILDDFGAQGFVDFFPISGDIVQFYTMGEACAFTFQNSSGDVVDDEYRSHEDGNPLDQDFFEVSDCRADLEFMGMITVEQCTALGY